MSTRAEQGYGRRPHATLACYMCRKRKIRCGRELPHCTICKDTSQECIYPAKPMRPGPKIGSTHATSQKRQLDKESQKKYPQERRDMRLEPPGMTGTTLVDDSSPSSVPSQPPQSPPQPNNVLTLSFILHPTFENCSPDHTDATPNFADTDVRYTEALMTSCKSLGLTLLQLNTLLPRYFETFTSFQLFRLSELQTKLWQIPTPTQRTALLAAMLAFGLKGLDKDDLHNILQEPVLSGVTELPSIHFRSIGIKHMEQAIEELDDEPLSLPLLQALILNTHCLLVQRVRGKAWRCLGTCIRTAYELNLHLIDAGKQSHEPISNVEKWCIEEEWRRAWWAIWEMDVFASVIRRCPAGIDWSQNETFLPAEDARWYGGQPQQSCFLDIDVTSRWKSLVKTKNRSPSAWFILLNSLMKDAQTISSPTSVDKPLLPDRELLPEASGGIIDEHQRLLLREKAVATKRLSTISNALYCAIMALPEELQYHGQHLNFGGKELQKPGAISRRLTHSFIYSIYLMTQFTKLMILKYHVFRTGRKWTLYRNQKTMGDGATEFEDSSGSPLRSTWEPQYLSQYFEAADNVVSIIRGSSGDHYKHVNPFLASTTWLAGAVQLLHRSELEEDEPDRELITSNFELVSLIYQKTVDFWNMSPVPLHNWETLEKGLESVKNNPDGGDKFHYETPCIFTAGNKGRLAMSKTKPSSSTASTLASGYDNVNLEIARCTTNTSDRGDDVPEASADIYNNGTLSQVSPPQYQYQENAQLVSTTQKSYDMPPSSLGQPLHHDQNLSIDITSSDMDRGTGRASLFPSTYAPVATLSPNFMDASQFVLDRDFNLDFSTYLDEMFSGSYLP